MTRIVNGIILMCLSFVAFAKTTNPLCTGVSGNNFITGDGSPTNPYLICNKLQLNRIGSEAALLSKSFKLGSDLNFANSTFVMIGSQNAPFTGNFDGDRYTFSSIFLNPENTYAYIGLFANVLNSTIKNLTVNGITITLFASHHVGGLIASANRSTLSNLHVNALNIVGNDRSGGLVGDMQNSSLSNSSVEGILNQTFGSDASGGLVGYANNVNVEACYTNVRLLNSYVDPYGVSDIGGMFGLIGFSTIKNVYARGDIDYSKSQPTPPMIPDRVGGLIGTLYNSTLEFAYYAGKINILAGSFGGAVGAAYPTTLKLIPAPSENVFWDTQLSGILVSAFGIGQETATMQQVSFWTNQGFDSNVWNLVDGQYPTLKELPEV